ncbi:MAG: hypothetical protein JXA71_08605 [Chitinispirillaceae bacterium]|nr:hypothetical protein [Chitinispirillaceae bacterium]
MPAPMNQWNFQSGNNEMLREIYCRTDILRRPISGFVSGYHHLPYILIAPNDENPSHTVEINGKINVSPKFIISPQALQETFGEVFDPETFDHDIQGRVFSFAYSNNKHIKVENEYFKVQKFEEKPEEHLNRVNDSLMAQENTRTGLIFGPKFHYYPVSLDRFISEIVDREFRL